MLVENVLIYLRKSRKDIEFYNEPIEKTLQRHEKVLQDYALTRFKQKIPEENIFREVVSGDTIAERPKMQELMSLIENSKYKAVLVIEIERLARGNTIDQGIIAQTFELTNTLIITPQKDYDLSDEMDKSFFEDGLYQSRKYLMYTKKILNRGRIESVKEGKFVGSVTPYGYDKEKLKGEKGFKLVINEDEAKIVRIIFDMYTQKYGTQQIAHFLNKMNVKPRKGDVWTDSAVRNIVNSKAVNGKVTWNMRKTVFSIDNGVVKKSNPFYSDPIIVNGLHEAIIDDDLWDKAQKIKENNRREKPLADIRNPLAGIIKCKICGRNMVRRPYHNNYNDILMCHLPGCNTSTALNIVEKRLLSELKKILSQYEVSYKDKVSKKSPIDYDSLKKETEQEIQEYKQRLDKIYDLFETGIYDSSEFEIRRKEIKSEIASKEKEIDFLNEKQKDEAKKDYSEMIPKIKNILTVYDNLSIKDKNDLLKSVIDCCYYYKQNKNGRWDKKDIENFVLEIKLKI